MMLFNYTCTHCNYSDVCFVSNPALSKPSLNWSAPQDKEVVHVSCMDSVSYTVLDMAAHLVSLKLNWHYGM